MSTDPFPDWKPGDQFCPYCKKIVDFPHHCSTLVDNKGKPTHDWVQCLEKGHELKHKVDGRSPSNRYVKCHKCTWHVPMEYIETGIIYPCPQTGIPTPFTETTYTGMSERGSVCPRCKTPLMSTKLDANTTRYYCPKCSPIPREKE